MCVLLVHHRVRADAPVVLLANRDEAYDRAYDPPHRWAGRGGVVAPRDRTAGGTWLGVTSAGLVVAITNRPAPPRPDLRSRGLLAADALRRASAQQVLSWIGGHLETHAYAPFNLLVVERASGFVVHHEGGRTDLVDLRPGVHVLTNLHDLDVAPVPDAGLPREGEPLGDLLARLEVLASDATTPLPGDHRIFKRGGTRGTVCSATIAVPADPSSPPRLRFAAGPPDVAPFEDVAVPPPGAATRESVA